MTMLSNSFQEQLVFLEGPSPLSKGGIEGMDPALATCLVRSAVDEFGYLYPIDFLAGGWNGGNNERRHEDWVGMD